MRRGIEVKQLWADEDLVELELRVSDGESVFANRVHSWPAHLAQVATAVASFDDPSRTDELEIRFGSPDLEYAIGTFWGRFRYFAPGRLLVTCVQEREFREFGSLNLANSATTHLRSEPALLQRFATELRALAAGMDDEAFLEAI